MIHQPLALAATIAAITALGFWLEGRYAWARRASGSLLVILFGAVLSNLGLVPAASPVYGAITGPITSLAIVWLLFAVDLRDLRAAGPRMLLAFGLAVAATATGAFLAALAFGGVFGGETWRLAGVMTGTYSGGSLNFVAVGREVGLSGALFTAAAASDNVLTALWMGATLVLPAWLRRFYPLRPAVEGPDADSSEAARAGSPQAGPPQAGPPQAGPPQAGPPQAGPPQAGSPRAEPPWAEPPQALAATAGPPPAEPPQAPSHPLLGETVFKPFDFLALLALGLGLILAADAIAARMPAIPSVLWLTTLALGVAQIPAVRRLSGAMLFGLVALNLFFAVIGIASRISEILRVGLEVFYFTAIVIAVHGILLYAGARLLRLDVETASVASQAAVGGPSTAMALAVSRGWRELVLPGLVVGLLGYAVGNYAGLAVAALVRAAF